MGRRGFLGPRKEVPRAWTAGSPPWLHLVRSFPGDYPCSSTSPPGQVLVRCELLPPVQPRVPALEGRSDWLHRPSLGGLWATSSQCPNPSLSALSSLLCGTLSLQDFQPFSSPHRESQFPKYQASRELRSPQPTPLCASPPSSPSPQPSSLPLPPDLSTPLAAFCFSLRLPLGF